MMPDLRRRVCWCIGQQVARRPGVALPSVPGGATAAFGSSTGGQQAAASWRRGSCKSCGVMPDLLHHACHLAGIHGTVIETLELESVWPIASDQEVANERSAWPRTAMPDS